MELEQAFVNMKVSFQELTPHNQEKLLNLIRARLIMKGSSEKAEDIIARKKPKTRKQWASKMYYYMKSIDKHRKELGLEPLYNCDLHLSTSVGKLSIGQ